MNFDFPDLLARRAELSPDVVAIEDVARGKRLTYAELDDAGRRTASFLLEQGIGAGDRVAILCRNRPEFFELLFACARVGALLVPLNWRMPSPELDALIADAEPKLLVYGNEDRDLVVRLDAPPASMELDGDYRRAVEASPPEDPRRSWSPDSGWYLLYTSGTTGRAKGVIYTFRMALANYVSITAAIGLGASDCVPCFLPLFHTAGINLHALPALIAGGTVIMLPGFDAGVLVKLLEDRRLDHFFAVPTVYQALLDNRSFLTAPLDAVRTWGCGGAPLPDSLARAYRALGVRVRNGMGMTETGPTALLADAADAWDRIGSVGKAQLLCSARIVDAESRDVSDGEIGELLFAGPGVTPGYWRNEEATRAAFTEDGWLRSGDLARREAGGHFYIVGRAKEMFISGGENVYPAEIENVLCGHADVIDAAVVGRPDQKWGEVGVAFVQLAANATANESVLQEFCRQRLAAFKVPRAFHLVADFPRTSAGKIRKHLLASENKSAAELRVSA